MKSPRNIIIAAVATAAAAVIVLVTLWTHRPAQQSSPASSKIPVAAAPTVESAQSSSIQTQMVEERDPEGKLSARGPAYNGIRHGKWEGWYVTGTKGWEGEFVHGKREGKFIMFDPTDGQPSEKVYYSGGVLQKRVVLKEQKRPAH